MALKRRAPRCTEQIDGPRRGPLRFWHRRCKKRTLHPSGKCDLHRKAG